MSTIPPHVQGPVRSDWRPSRTAMLIAAAAFAFGLLMFLLLWLDQRNDKTFFRAPVARKADAPQFDPLPAPLPAGQEGARSGMSTEREQLPPEEQPQLVEEAPPPPPPPAAPEPERDVAERSAPVLVSSPPPRYPAQARRRRESGTVLVRVDIGPDGVPTSTSLVQSSRSRSLDKEALDAVRRWRFQPAMVDGRPTVGSVVVPINFDLDG